MADTAIRLPARLPLAILLSAMFELAGTATAIATTLTVSDCTDGGGSGTLRKKIASAASNDTVQIPLSCSVITLSQGSINIGNTISNLTIVGQGSSKTTIDAGSASNPAYYDRAFLSEHTGTLSIKSLTIANARPNANETPSGGCIFSASDLLLEYVVVKNCEVRPNGVGTLTRGGAIYSAGSVFLGSTTITGARAFGENEAAANGGAIYTRNGVTMIYSTISDNAAFGGAGGGGSRGGAIFSAGNGPTFILQSTISGNSADNNSAIQASWNNQNPNSVLDFINSTVTGNRAGSSGTITNYGITYVDDSTIAYNRVGYSNDSLPSGLYGQGKIVARSSIFASNSADSGEENNVSSNYSLSGSNDLITAGIESMVDTIQTCPKLGHLSNNGGPTKTIPLRAGSIAIGNGTANGQTTDQRGTGFGRTVGAATDIGAYERQSGAVDDVIFFSEFDSRCN